MEIWSIIGFVCPKTEPKTYHISTRRLKLSFTFSDEKNGVRTLRPKTLRPRTLRPRTLRPKRTLRPNVNYAQGNYDNVISYAHIPLVP